MIINHLKMRRFHRQAQRINECNKLVCAHTHSWCDENIFLARMPLVGTRLCAGNLHRLAAGYLSGGIRRN